MTEYLCDIETYAKLLYSRMWKSVSDKLFSDVFGPFKEGGRSRRPRGRRRLPREILGLHESSLHFPVRG